MQGILTYGMVGGGPDSLIGDTHRKAIALDNSAKLVAGVFSRDKEKSLITARENGVSEDRCYADYIEMAKKESEREDGIDFVVIVTPNNSHYEICKAFIDAGINIACDKPVTVTYAQAKELEEFAREKDVLFMVTYTYMGYVTAKYARNLVASGEIGEIRNVMAEYPQGWLANEHAELSKQGKWRTDPEQSGATNCLGDIGTHVENAVATMTGLRIKRVLAKMDIIVPGRVLDDNTVVLVEYDNGAIGTNWSSQFAIGHDNGLRVRIYGSKGTILWFQETNEKITIIYEDETIKEVHRGYKCISENAARYQRLASGHAEGVFEAMANLYVSFAECLNAKKHGTFTTDLIDYPTISDGARGIAYVEACIESSRNGNVWIEMN